MQVAAASMTGIMKVVVLEGDSGRVVNSWGSPAREREIQRMALHTPAAEAALVAHADGAVRVVGLGDGCESASVACGATGGAFVGLEALGAERALVARAGGSVRVQRLKESGREREEENGEGKTTASDVNTGKGQKEKMGNDKGGREEEKELFDISLADGLETAREKNGVTAVGGRDIPLQLWDLTTAKKTWTMRNVRHNAVNLPERVWVRSMCFLEDSLLATATHAGAVRLYDPRAQRRPLVTLPLGGKPHTCLEQSIDGRRLFVADVTGRVSSLCLRTRKEEGVYKAKIVGSVRSIACHSGGETLACVGLDRKLRVFDISSRRLVSELYLKQMLTSCLFMADAPPPPEPADPEEEDMEAIWKGVGVVEAQKKRKGQGKAKSNAKDGDDGTDSDDSNEDEESGEEESGEEESEEEESGEEESVEEESDEEDSEDEGSVVDGTDSEEEASEEANGSGTSEDSDGTEEEEEPQKTAGKRKGPPVPRPSKRRRAAF